MNNQNEFVDIKHEVQDKYFELMEKYYNNYNSKFINEMIELIKKDDKYFEPYLILYKIYTDKDKIDKAKKYLDTAYQKACEIVIDKNGNWPKSMKWGRVANRHIIKTFVNKGVDFWNEKKTDEALKLFRNLLKSNPNDNAGVRNFILAIRMGLSYIDFENKFNKGGYYDSGIINWFEKNYNKYPDEFDWWIKETE